ncbi:MAG: hypothetical protein IKC71_01745 [Clostridia bacterium]|nr:hypothetical protein [Clostridia bacterium]
MKSWREKGLEEAEKQRCIDEIHQKPEVKKVFAICEIFMTIDWITNMIFLVFLGIGIWTQNLENVIEFENVLFLLLDAVGGYFVAGGFILLKFLLGMLKKKYRTKLQVLEDAGLEEIKKAKEEGTYQEGRKPKLAYRVYRAIRSWTTILLLIGLVVVFFIKFY